MTTADEYVPSDEQVRGRYCDGTYVQTGHTTEGEDFDAWLARVRRDAAREALDGLAANMSQIANGSPDPLTRTSATITARLAGEYKLSIYPEESP